MEQVGSQGKLKTLWNQFYIHKSIAIDNDGKRSEIYVLPEHKSDLMEFSKVSIVKFILTEGEKFIIFAFYEFVSAQHLKGS